MGLLDGKLVVNPENGNRSGADLDLVITNSESVIPMIEAGATRLGCSAGVAIMSGAKSEATY